MTKRVASTYTNIVRWEQDLSSLRKVKDEIRKVKASMQGTAGIRKSAGVMERENNTLSAKNTLLADILRKEEKSAALRVKSSKEGFRQSVAGLTPKATSGSAAKTAFADILRKEEKAAKQASKWSDQRAFRTEKFLLSNRLITDENRKQLRLQLLRAKSAEEFSLIQSRIRRKLTDQAKEQNRINNLQKKQTIFGRRFSASIAQMVGGVGSVFAMVQGTAATLRTGMDFEAVNKTMLAVSSSSEEAAENFEFVRGEARRLGIDLVQAGKGYSRLLASAGNNMARKDVQELFTSVTEVGTVLGLSQDELAGTTRAIQQMVSKGVIQSKTLDPLTAM